MLRLAPLAVLAAAPFAQARFGRFAPRNAVEECCPCPTSGAPGQGTTVTVTHPAASPETKTVYATQGNGMNPGTQETVTVERTVTQQGATVTKEGSTVYVTNSAGPETQVVTQVVTVNPEPGSLTTVVGNETPSDMGTMGPEPTVVITTIHPGEMGTNEPMGPKTVTVSKKPASVKTVTVSPGNKMSETPKTPEVVTVTANPENEASSSPCPSSGATVVTKTVNGDNGNGEGPGTVMMSSEPSVKTVSVGKGSEGPKTVILSNEPIVKTVTLDNGSVISKTKTTAVTVSAAPQVQTVTKNTENLKTVTRTVSAPGSGGDTIEIIIININTGESTCHMKHNGMPCDADMNSNGPSMTGTKMPGTAMTSPCPSVNTSTSLSTVYNTVLVTVNTGMGGHNATASMGVAMPTGIGGAMGRKPRGPLRHMKW